MSTDKTVASWESLTAPAGITAVCSKCGATMDAGAVACGKCGAMLTVSGGDEQKERVRLRIQAAVGNAFRVVELLGRGGMGIVFRAVETALEREVALKVLAIDPVLAPDAFARFEREAKLAARLDHPNIVPIFAVGKSDTVAFYTMRLVRGGNLEDMLEGKQPLAVDHTIQILRDVAAALDYAHANGVVHRDIKPANVLIGDTGHALVADFGIAKALGSTGGSTGTGTAIIGSPGYMSPEQWRGEQVDGRADQYALGVVAFEMLAGRRPFEAPRVQDILKLHLHTPPPDLSAIRQGLDPAIADAIMRAMSKSADDRFETVTAFVDTMSGRRTAATARITRTTRAIEQSGRGAPVAPARRRSRAPLIALATLAAVAGVAVSPPVRPHTDHALDAMITQAQRVVLTGTDVRPGDDTVHVAPVDSAALIDSLHANDAAPVATEPDRRLPIGIDPRLQPSTVPNVDATAPGFVRIVVSGGNPRARIDGRMVGFTPLVVGEVLPGDHYVTLEGADLFRPTQITVHVASNDTVTASFAVAKVARDSSGTP